MITDVRVNLIVNARADRSGDRLLAFCTITIGDAFVIRDVKIIHSPRGPFVAMPSRKLCDRCHDCGGKNHLRARYCNDCGARLRQNSTPAAGRSRLHADIAHPINTRARETLEACVLAAYDDELERSKTDGYVPTAGDDFDDA